MGSGLSVGYWDSADRKKVKSVIDQNPDIDLRMVFQAPYNTISKIEDTMPSGVNATASNGRPSRLSH